MNKKNTLKVLSMIAFFICSLPLFSQEQCGMDDYMKEQMKDPEFVKQYEKSQEKFRAQLAKNLERKPSSKRMNTIVIPVAVHFPGAQESDRACLEALAQNQIDILNEDYTGANTDISGWTDAAAYYPNTYTGAIDLYFCLATMNHPTGLDPELVEGGPAVTIGYEFGEGGATGSAWGGYLNILIKDLGGDLLGYSPLGGIIANGNSAVINLGAFGSGAGCPDSGIVPQYPYNLGRVVTHELGHFFNLLHPFTGTCTTDDGIEDTPNQNYPSDGCPTLGNTPACDDGEQELFQNFMNYTNHACMFMFTEGQMTISEAFIMTLESQFKPNVVACSAAPNFAIAATNNSASICLPTNEVVYDLTYNTIGGNADTTTFSATGLPAGATATFSPTSLNADDNFTLTVGNLPGATTGNYNFNITATGVVTKTIGVDLTIEESIPTMPELTSPADGQTGAALYMNLAWDTATNAATHTVQTATNANFTDNLTSDELTSTTFTTPLLNESTQYFWRVKSTNGCGGSSYSTARNFTTGIATCSIVESTENDIDIPDTGSNPHIIASILNVAENTSITDVNVTINVDHSSVGEIGLSLISPAGTPIFLLPVDSCPNDTDGIAVTFDDQAAGSVVCSTSPPAVGGTIQPYTPLSALNGESSLGDWQVVVADLYPSENGGTVLNYSIEICGTSSSLSVDEFGLASSLSIWPNPSNGEINLSFNAQNDKNVNVKLYDLRGRLISKQSFDSTGAIFNRNIQFGELETAIYILSVENAGEVINKRIVIE